ncbi:hypothetical protein M011DRAFT_492433 [Sporormia fimetaria CBS 119925]|uniref:Amino acid transporter n=1 Tax=Sporormia fimetaria CBS 119925 TaxID=1340428 RepID=A0A6A6VHQ4_9PLEO|nr:hypothetical protein M011DRAFT_492433 [Sporormia fimetaria CBS 119925]
MLACVGQTAVALSLAELASIDPTVGAQYRWSANSAPFSPRFWGLLQGWIATAGWCFACTGGPPTLALIATSLASFNNSNFVAERWHFSLLMVAFMVVPYLVNLWFRKVLNTLEMSAAIGQVCLMIVVIALLLASGPKHDSSFVFKTLTWEQSGWGNKGVSFGIGTLTPVLCFSGVDSILHLSDEIKQVRTRVPHSMVFAVVSNSVMLMIFSVVLLYCMPPLDQLMLSPLPLIDIVYNATNSRAATNAILIGVFILFTIWTFNSFASVSRLIWCFAMDNGLPYSNWLSKIHPTLNLHLNALILIGVIVGGLSLIYIGSVHAFSALLSLQSLALNGSYVIPISFMILRKKRGPDPPYGPFKMGKIGIYVNTFALCFILYSIAWMPLPQTWPVTSETMNYSGPIFLAVILGAIVDWFTTGKKRFQMPVRKYE